MLTCGPQLAVIERGGEEDGGLRMFMDQAGPCWKKVGGERKEGERRSGPVKL
jgi:hypothetical protein